MTVDLATLRDRLDLAVTVVSDEELAEILAACTEQQDAVVLHPTDDVGQLASASLDRALIRRCAREIAAKGMPLGAQTTEFGIVYVPGGSDPIIRGLEANYLRGAFA